MEQDIPSNKIRIADIAIWREIQNKDIALYTGLFVEMGPEGHPGLPMIFKSDDLPAVPHQHHLCFFFFEADVYDYINSKRIDEKFINDLYEGNTCLNAMTQTGRYGDNNIDNIVKMYSIGLIRRENLRDYLINRFMKLVAWITMTSILNTAPELLNSEEYGCKLENILTWDKKKLMIFLKDYSYKEIILRIDFGNQNQGSLQVAKFYKDAGEMTNYILIPLNSVIEYELEQLP